MKPVKPVKTVKPVQIGRIESLKRQLNLHNEKKDIHSHQQTKPNHSRSDRCNKVEKKTVGEVQLDGGGAIKTKTLKAVLDVQNSIVSQRKAQMMVQKKKYQNRYYNQINNNIHHNTDASDHHEKKGENCQQPKGGGFGQKNVEDTQESTDTKCSISKDTGTTKPSTLISAKNTGKHVAEGRPSSATKDTSSSKNACDDNLTDTSINESSSNCIKDNTNPNATKDINNTVHGKAVNFFEKNKSNNSLNQLERKIYEQRKMLDDLMEQQRQQKLQIQGNAVLQNKESHEIDNNNNGKIEKLENFLDKQSKMIEKLVTKQQKWEQQQQEQQPQQRQRAGQKSSTNSMQGNELRIVQLERTLDGQKIIIDSVKRQQQLTDRDNDGKITKLEKMLNDQKKMFADFVAKTNEKKKGDTDHNYDVTGIKSDIMCELESKMNEQRKIIKEIKISQDKEQYLCRAMLDILKKQYDEKISRTEMALKDLEHSHNEKIFQLLRAIENLTQASEGLKKEVGALKSAKTGGYFQYLKG